jgi:adenylate kinase
MASEDLTPARAALEDAATYVERHKVFQLFESLLQDVLVARPSDPLSHLITSLKREPVPKVVIAGPPGAQARSVCELLASKKGMVHVIASDVVRELARLNFKPAVEAKALIDSGKEVPDAVMLEMLKEKLTSGDCRSTGWVLEGYPSTATQARAMCTAGLLPTRFIHLALSDAAVTRRLTGRRVDPVENKVYHLQDAPPPNGEVANRLVQRGEDMPPHVAERLAAYRQHMSGVLPCFSKVLAELNGDEAGGVDAILERALPLVSPYMPSRAPRGAARVCLLGGPGSNAEALGAALALRYGAKLVSAVELLHSAALSGDKKAKAAMEHPNNPLEAGRPLLGPLILERIAKEDVRTSGFVLVGFPATPGHAKELEKAKVWLRDVVHLKLSDDDALAAVTQTRYDPYDGEVYHLESKPPRDYDTAERLVQHPNHKPAVVKKLLSEYNKELPKLLKVYSGMLRTEDARRSERELVERLAPCFLSL